MAITLTAGSGTYHLAGSDASLLIPWGGDADFNWAAPTIAANIFLVAAADANVAAPQSAFRWE